MASKVSGVIEKINVSGTERAIASSAYGYCETAAIESAKVVDMTDFKLYEGVTVHVKFKNGNTVTNPTLNIQSTGAKPIVFSSTLKDIDGNFGWHSDEILTLTYDGTSWVVTNSAYATSAGSVLSGNIKPIESKEYTGFYATANNDNRKIAFFGTVIRNNVNIPWRIRLKVKATIPNYPDYAYTDWDIDYWGHVSATKAQYIKVNHGTNYALYSLQVYYPKDTTDNNILIGVYVYANNNYNNSAYARTLKIDYLGSENCTFTFNQSLVYRESITTANYTAVGVTLNSTGFQETGDSNSTYNLGNNQLYNTIKVAEAIATERIIVGKTDNLYYELKAGVSFDLTKPILWLTTGLSANGTNYANIFTSVYDRNLTNVKSTFSGAQNSMVYVKGIINGNIFTVDSDIIVNSLPDNADGNAYINIGRMGNQSTGLNYFYFYGGLTPTIWEFKNGSIRPYEASNNLSELTDADDLKAIEALSGTTGLLKKTAANTWTLDTSSYVTSSGVTSITLKAGAGIKLDTDNTAITSTGTRTISINGIDATNGDNAKCLTQKGNWVAFNNYSHPTGDGNLHVPATGSSNNGKVLKAGSTAGSISWGILSASDVGALASGTTVTNVAISADITTNKDYAVVFGTTPSDGTQPTAAKTEGLQKNISKFYFNPYEGNLNATSFSVNESVTLKYNTTDSALEFVFG